MTELFCTMALFTVTRTTPDMSEVEVLQLHTISLAEIDLRIINTSLDFARDYYYCSHDITGWCSHGLPPPPPSIATGHQ